jgi:tetratricopeptide (TPR) repeat protein
LTARASRDDHSRVWSSYSARQAAQLIGLPESAVRSLARAGVIGAAGEVPLKLEFRDLAALRTIKALVDEGVPLARVRREVIALHRRLPAGRRLTELSLEAQGGHIRVRGSAVEDAPVVQLELALVPETLFALDGADDLGELHEIPVRRDTAAPQPVAAYTADEWFERALALEDAEVDGAIDAYRRCLRLRPDSTEAWINLGRLYAENGDSENASECFGTALKLDPHDATALYNLGVVAQDAGREKDAILLYMRALEIDPELAEAHYNLATIFDQRGESQQAIRHINEYRKLTR